MPAAEKNEVPEWKEGKIYLSPEDEKAFLNANETIAAPGISPLARYHALKVLNELGRQSLAGELRVLRMHQSLFTVDVARSPEGQKIQQRIVALQEELGQKF